MNEQNDPTVQILENATRDDVRPGDHMVWESSETEYGVTIMTRREGIADYRDALGNWHTKYGGDITMVEGDDITLTIRRPVTSKESAL